MECSGGKRSSIEPSPTSSQGMNRGMRFHAAWLEVRSTSEKIGRRWRLASSRRCRASRAYWSGIEGQPKRGPR